MRWVWALLLCSSATTTLADPVFKADFEKAEAGAPAGWQFLRQRGKCDGAWDETEPPPTGHSIRLEVESDASARATWEYRDRIPVKPSAHYRLSVRVMLAEVMSGARVYLIAYENGVEGPTHWHTTPYLNGTQDWRTYEVPFTTRPDTTWLKLQCKLWDGTGYAWFDDIVIEEVKPSELPASSVSQRQPPPNDGWPLQLMWYPAQRRPDNALCLLAESFNPVAMFFWGRKSEIMEPCLVIEAPVGLMVNGPAVHGTAPMPQPLQVKPEPIEAEGQKLLRWRIPILRETLVKNLKPDGPFWTDYHFIYIVPEKDCPRQFTWRWQLEIAGRLGPAHSIPARIVSRNGGVLSPVSDFVLYAQHTGALRYPTKEGRRRVLDHLYYAGIRGGLSLTHWQPEEAAPDKELHESGFFTWAWNWDGYNGVGAQDQRLVFDDGKISPKLVCPQVQADRAEPWWSRLVLSYRKPLASNLKTLIINYEPPWFNCCFCPRCRKAFASFADLDEQKVTTMPPKEIQALPDHLWGRFRADQNARIIKNHVAAIHEIDPEVRVGICGSSYTPESAQRGMDIRLFEPDIAFHAPMIYYVGTLYEHLVRSTCENTKAPVLPFLLASDLAVPKVFPLPEDVRLNMLATALSGGRGAILWVGIESLDGEYMNALRQSLEEIRRLQEYIIGGSHAADVSIAPQFDHVRRVKVRGKELTVTSESTVTPVRSWAWKSPRGRLVALINYDREASHKVRLSSPGITSAKNIFGPSPLLTGNDLLLNLGPYEAVAITW